MPRRFEPLVRDRDGTLMDSAATIVAFLQARRDLALSLPSEEQARHIIGLGSPMRWRACRRSSARRIGSVPRRALPQAFPGARCRNHPG